jgi:hypothetical protein
MASHHFATACDFLGVLVKSSEKLVPFSRLADYGVTYCRDHLRRKVAAGEFPTPVVVSDRRIAWIEAEVIGWITSLPRASTRRVVGLRGAPEAGART